MNGAMEERRLVLASGSARRRAYFARFFPGHEAVAPQITEGRREGEIPSAYIRRMAREKALEVLGRASPGSVVVAADTVVVLDGEALGKPADGAEAARMLRALSGRGHEVETAFHIQEGLGAGAKRRTGLVRTRVVFRGLGEGEIAGYVASGEPMGKAGAYAIQGFGGGFIVRIRGSATNVVGLPMAEVIEALGEFGFLPTFWVGG